MKHYKIKEAVVCLLLLAVIPLYGCGIMVAGGAAAGATYVYTEGWVERDYAVNLEKAYNAAVRAAESLGMTVTKTTREVASAEIKATKEEEDYWIKIKEQTSDLTTLSVRVGLLGNKEASYKIHEEIIRSL